MPEAEESPGPGPEAAYDSQVQLESKDEYEAARSQGLVYHVDIAKYKVSEIKDALDREIVTVTAQRDHVQKEIDWHKGNPQWSGRHPGSAEESAKNLGPIKERLANLEDIKAKAVQKEREWRELEKKGVLYGHKEVKPEDHPHRTEPHINVAGRRTIETHSEKFELKGIKITIYVRSRRE
jgi:hypothetical protein